MVMRARRGAGEVVKDRVVVGGWERRRRRRRRDGGEEGEGRREVRKDILFCFVLDVDVAVMLGWD